MARDSMTRNATRSARQLPAWGVRSDVVFVWGLFCACYWLFPWWPRGQVSWDLKFAALAVYSVGCLALLGWWNRTAVNGGDGTSEPSWRSTFSAPWGTAVLGLVAGASVLQYREIQLLILSGPDEPYRVLAVLDQWRAITDSDAGSGMAILALGSAVLLWVAGLMLVSTARPATACRLIGCGLFAVALVANYHLVLAVGSRWGGNPRWPPLGTLVEVFSMAVLGPGETAARLPALLFFLLAGVFLFRLVALEASSQAAFVATALLLAAPAFFTQGQLASRETAGAFFMTAAAYFLVRRWRQGNIDDLGWSIAMTLAAYLTRRPAIVFAVVILGVEIAGAAQRWRTARLPGLLPVIGQWVVGFGVLVAGALPWMFSTRTIRPFELSPGNWSDWELVVAYPLQVPVALGFVATLLGVTGAIAAGLRRRFLGLMALLWLGVVYALFTSDIPRWIPTYRFLALMVPPLAVLAGMGFDVVRKRTPRWARGGLLAAILIGAATSVVTWSSCGWLPSRLPKVPCRSEIPRYPFDQVVSWLDQNSQGPSVVTSAVYWQTSLEVYAAFQGVDRVSELVAPYGSQETLLNVGNLKDTCANQPVDFVVVPYSRQADRWVPRFMVADEARQLASAFDLKPGDVPTFTRGRQRLEVYPCPEAAYVLDELELPRRDQDHPGE